MHSDQKPTPALILPKLRKGLKIHFSDYDADGKPQWLIHDSGRNKFFIIGWVEYELLSHWDVGRTDLLINKVNEETTLNVDMNDLENLVKFLKHNYLLVQTGKEIYEAAVKQKLFKSDGILHWLVSYYLFFRIPLVHPDRFLDKTKIIADVIFHRYTAYFMSFLAVIAFYQLGTQWELFTHTFSSIFTLKGIFYYAIAYSFCKLCHELGHAYMCKRYGVPVPTMGLAFLVFWPVLYTDTTLSWTLSSKKRMRIALGGMWIETYIAIIAALIWCNSSNLTIQGICYLTIAVNWVASVLLNVSPFMRFDGYYVLADYLRIPNLQPRAFALTRWQLRRWLFNWPDQPPEKFSAHITHILIVYSLITWIYRLFIYFGIAILVYHFAIKLLGIILFVIEIFYFILGPFVNEIRFLIVNKEKFTFNTHVKCTLGFALFLLILFFLPVNESVKIPTTFSYRHQFLVAPEEGTLITEFPKVGSVVKANQPLAKLDSVDLDYGLEKLKLEYNKKLSELRRSTINSKFYFEKNILLSDINKEQAEYKKLIALRDKLTLSVPFNGVIIEAQTELKPGTVVMKNEWLGDLIDPNSVLGEAFVSQIDIHLISTHSTGTFYPEDLSEEPIPVKVSSVEVLNSTRLNCRYAGELKQGKNESMVVETPCFHVSDLGGNIPTYTSEEGDYTSVSSVYRILLAPENKIKLNRILRGTTILKTEPVSYAYRFFYKIKTIWIEESGF